MQALINDQAEIGIHSITTGHIGTLFYYKEKNSSILLRTSPIIPNQIAELFQKLNRIENLSSNWDTYNSEAPDLVAIKNAKTFLMDNYNLALPFYFLAPGVNGEIMIELKDGERSAELYFLPNGEDELILFEKDEEVFVGTINDHFQNLMDFFNS